MSCFYYIEDSSILTLHSLQFYIPHFSFNIPLTSFDIPDISFNIPHFSFEFPNFLNLISLAFHLKFIIFYFPLYCCSLHLVRYSLVLIHFNLYDILIQLYSKYQTGFMIDCKFGYVFLTLNLFENRRILRYESHKLMHVYTQMMKYTHVMKHGSA